MLKSTLSSLPSYLLSLFTIPQSVAARLERIQKNFLWGTTKEIFRHSLVVWDKVCLPVEVVGLGYGGLGCLTKPCSISGYGVLGRKLTGYGIRL